MQTVSALEQVAQVTRQAATTALANQQAATNEVQARTDAANQAATAAQNQAAIVAAQRTSYIQELANKQNTTVELINEREAALEAQRQEAARVAAEQAAAAAEAQRQADAAAAAQRQADAAAATQASSSSDDEDDDDTPSYSYDEPSYEEPSYSDEEPSYSYGGASTAIATAQSYLGVPYVWGGESYGGVDCSGLTMLAWESAGVYLPHLSRAQYGYGTHVPIGSMDAGDLIFWSSNGAQSGIYHVAIYLGGGQMIEAPTFGVPVRITGVYSWGSIMPYAVRL